ncbi:MAG TPA: efflux RND transporter periplasmic adaptor subunit [Terracidiphilus sp.]|nr:efflux RND transporter periplasmic adaptor subunit [Terracidiphilus sp.]
MTLPSPVRWLSLALLVLPLAAGCVGCRHTTKVSAETTTSADASLPIAPTVTPQRRALAQQLDVAGELIPYQQVELHAKVSGYIKHIYVDIGDRVHAGEDLADLEIPELVAQVDAAKAGVQRAQQDVLRAKSAVARDQAMHAALHSEYIRLKQAASQPGLIAQQELDDALAKDSSAEAQIEAAKANLSAMQQALSVAKADSEHYSALADYSHILAPFNGVVSWRYSDTGALVQAGTSSAGAQPVVKLDETDILRLRLPVPSELAPFVNDGDTAQIKIEDTGQKLTGKVVRTTGSLDLSTRTLQVEIDLKNPGDKLLPGMYADVTLNVQRSGTGLTLPIQAVDQTANPPFTYVVDTQGRIEKRELRLGVQSPTRVEVVSGIKAGDRVVATNLASYTPGEQVNPQPADLPASPGGNGE